MNLKQKLVEALTFLLSGGLFFIAFLFVFAKMFDLRMPVIQEYIPLIPLILLTVFIFFKKDE